MFEDLVKEKENEIRNQNLFDLRNNLYSKDYQDKISKHCNKFTLSQEEVNNQILENDIVASFFIKQPSKQNFTEKFVGELLGVSALPQQGKNCVRFDNNGNICHLKNFDTSKAADFKINNTYITQKFTRDFGGSQDNQCADVIQFLDNGSKNNKVAAILDGDYWNTKRKLLKKFYDNNANVQIYSMDEILRGEVSFE